MLKKQERAGVGWIASLALVLTMFAHDVLMAAVVLPVPRTPVSSVAADHGGHHGAAEAARGVVDEDAPSEHPEACGVLGDAISPAIPQPMVSDARFVDASFAAECSPFRPAAASGWNEPFHPPGVRRAYLQIYRI